VSEINAVEEEEVKAASQLKQISLINITEARIYLSLINISVRTYFPVSS
jgi:hypothetical protein